MNTAMKYSITENGSSVTKTIWLGRILSGLAISFFVMDGVMKFIKPQVVIELAQLCQGANSYEIANFATLLAQTAAQPTIVPIATLQAQGYVSPNFNAIGPSAQTYRLVIAQPAPNEIHPSIVSTGGTPLNELHAANIALAAGYAG